MTTGAGQMVSHYRLSEKLGEGGMGVVWRATDTRLGREVALKTLPESVAGDEERLARFDREARALASLSHPNIAAIFGIEAAGGATGLPVLVLEYVPGETLDERIRRGPMPLEEVLAVGLQLTAGLEAAHELGVIHRDLKPANIKLTPDDRVKILDFGLVKVLGTGISGPFDSGATETALADTPTVTTDQTRAGSFLGTIGYMSPEQARGKPVDKRADIWSFGCVLFEMLTGSSPFPGESLADKIGAILHLDPDWSKLPGSTPVELVELLHRCLEKDPKRRMRDIGDARIQLDALHEGRTRGPASASASALVPRRRRNAALAVPVALGCVALGLLLWNTLGPGSFWTAKPAGGTSTHLSIPLPPGMRVNGVGIGPGGRQVLLALGTGSKEDRSNARLYLRRFDSFELKPIPGTEGAMGGAFVNEETIGFAAPVAAGSDRQRVALAPLDGSAPPRTILDWNPGWSNAAAFPSGKLVATTLAGTSFVMIENGKARNPIPFRMGNIANATFENLTPLPPQAHDESVFFATASFYVESGFSVGIAAVKVATGEAKLLVEDAGFVRYSPTGHLLFTRGDKLFGIAFDPKKLELKGRPIELMSGLRTENSWSHAPFDYEDGTLLFRPGGMLGRQRRLAVLDANGTVTPWSDDRRTFVYSPAISPDGHRIATVITNPNAIYEIWVSDFERPGLRRLVAITNADCFSPVFSPDGRELAYTRMARDANDGIYVQSLSGGAPRLILKVKPGEEGFTPLAWSPDGKTMVARVMKGKKPAFTFAVGGSTTPEQHVIAGGDAVFNAAYSSDGSRLAYAADAGGRIEAFVASVAPDGTIPRGVMVSTRGGLSLSWGRDGALYYIEDNAKLMRVGFEGRKGVDPSPPVPVANVADIVATRPDGAGSVIALPNGKFLALQRGEDESDPTYVNVVLGFDGILKERVR